MGSLPEKIKAARSELGLSQTELGEQVGVSLRSILAYEKGEKYPRLSTLMRLGKALNVSTKYLSNDECENPLEDIEKDGHVSGAKRSFDSSENIQDLIAANNALFAGGNLTQEQKDEYFEAVMKAYLLCKEASKGRE